MAFGGAAIGSSVGVDTSFLPGLEAVGAHPLVAWPLFALVTWAAVLVFSKRRGTDRKIFTTARAIGATAIGLCFYISPAMGVIMGFTGVAVASRAGAA